MDRRDWAGTGLVGCLTIAAGLLRNHTLLWMLLAVVAGACAAVIAWDVWVNPTKPRGALRACYKGGRLLQKKLAQTKSLDLEADETEARYSVSRWAEKTWKVLKQHFEGYAQDFFGPGKMVLAETPPAFDLYCQHEIERFGSADAFLTQKLQYIENLLRKDGPQ